MRPHSGHLIQTSHIHCTIFNIRGTMMQKRLNVARTKHHCRFATRKTESGIFRADADRAEKYWRTLQEGGGHSGAKESTEQLQTAQRSTHKKYTRDERRTSCWSDDNSWEQGQPSSPASSWQCQEGWHNWRGKKQSMKSGWCTKLVCPRCWRKLTSEHKSNMTRFPEYAQNILQVMA